MSIIIKSGASGNLLTIDSSGAARATIYDSTGTAITNVTQSGLIYSGVSYTQNEFTSTNNSSTANLASGATFTGTSDATVGRDAIQISFFADQQCTIQVQQAQEVPGVNWNTVDSYVVLASTGDARVFKAIGSSIRVLVTNNGGSTTTALRLQTVLVPASNISPRALTTLGNVKFALSETTILKTTYAAAVSTVTPPATPTDMITITGSATRTIRVISWEVSSTQTTAGVNTYFLVKRSTANTAGTSSSVTAVPLDSNNAAATATVLQYTANPTLGTTVGNIKASRLLTPAPATAQFGIYTWSFDSLNAQPVVLRGTSQVLALNFGGAALPAGMTMSSSIVWTEEV